MKKLGIDIGSTTVKFVVSDGGEILLDRYERHFSKPDEALDRILAAIGAEFGEEEFSAALTGSAGMGIAESASLPFVQEVFAEQLAVKKYCPGTDVVIELGGEDAKILFLSGGFEMRMNGSCAGGTGAFIDQMAMLMDVTPDQLGELAEHSGTIYTVASRCGVFAKSDVQPLLNQGAKKEDVSASILRAVVNQTVAGLAQGRTIEGNILYLGGPLTFLPALRKSFDEVLKTVGVCPERSLYYAAIGAAEAGVGETLSAEALRERLKNRKITKNYGSAEPLFSSREEYGQFKKRHSGATGPFSVIESADGGEAEWYLGVDAGSTTVKCVLCAEDGRILEPFYTRSDGDPVSLVKGYLDRIAEKYPKAVIRSAAVTGYGEEIIRSAFDLPFGVVETVAHYTAAKKFLPDVDFILDIGGQDIKCFRIRGGAVDNLYLNEACSSGCGSFLQTFAGALGYTAAEFSDLALFASSPVDLGSRCTVFMNSSVKQAQKDGAKVEDIAAGLSMSVVKNALYKVIRCANADRLGKNIVVQGGTFSSDAVLRAFEKELGRDVVRPVFAPLMGALGAALYSAEKAGKEEAEKRFELRERLDHFVHERKPFICRGCTNHCHLTVNTFSGGRRFIAGNRCDNSPAASGTGDLSRKKKDSGENHYDLYEEKLRMLSGYIRTSVPPELAGNGKPTVGIPLGLNNYELLPFWHTFFDTLGFNVITSPLSCRETYLKGQHTIPSDTACYPAKLMHGHIEELLEAGPDAIFYPDMSYNTDEHLGVNHFNCPVVAYYPELLGMNVPQLSGKPGKDGKTAKNIRYINDFLSLADKKQMIRRMREILPKYFPKLDTGLIPRAADAAYKAYAGFLAEVRKKAEEYLAYAGEKHLPVIVLCGRPYHLDPEINHGINLLIRRLGSVILTEDSVSDRVKAFPTGVRNQWTYHARLYAAAKFVAEAPKDLNINLIQLVSFGCGVDAITTDETRSIIESAGKIYTQIKIDEISNNGAVNIRLRSLFAAI